MSFDHKFSVLNQDLWRKWDFQSFVHQLFTDAVIMIFSNFIDKNIFEIAYNIYASRMRPPTHQNSKNVA